MIQFCGDEKCSCYGKALVNTKEYGFVCPSSVKKMNLTVEQESPFEVRE